MLNSFCDMNPQIGFRILPAALAAFLILSPIEATDELEVVKMHQRKITLKLKKIKQSLSKISVSLQTIEDNSALARVSITAYHAVKEQCDETPWITASGASSRPGRTLAVSRLLKKRLALKWGDLAIIPQRGLFVVQDLMASRFLDDRIDIMVPLGHPGFKETRNIVFLRQYKTFCRN